MVGPKFGGEPSMDRSAGARAEEVRDMTPRQVRAAFDAIPLNENVSHFNITYKIAGQDVQSAGIKAKCSAGACQSPQGETYELGVSEKNEGGRDGLVVTIAHGKSTMFIPVESMVYLRVITTFKP